MPWNNFKPKPYEVGQKCTDVYYHEYQLLQVQNILEHKTPRMLCRNPMHPTDKEIANAKVHLTGINMDSFESSYNYVTRIAGVMMLLEERYVKPATIFLHVNNAPDKQAVPKHVGGVFGRRHVEGHGSFD